ncbi:MAG: sugar transferase [Chloroflexales bacterium]|nr:sugar transferase [Chloroflexales bacterium]
MERLSISVAEPHHYADEERLTIAATLHRLQLIAFSPAGSTAYIVGKRLIDIVVSIATLLLSLPVMLGLALLIRLDSPGPALFCQKRVGKDGRLFTFYKFRTMWLDARERFPELYTYSYSAEEIGEMYFKQPDDPRLTRLGRWLRKTSLDELPNFVNVLLGHMSVVGPRPEIPEMLPYYSDTQLMKFSVLPGVTGLAQISGRAALRFQETIHHDLTYCYQRDLWLDFQIILRTIRSIVYRSGAF